MPIFEKKMIEKYLKSVEKVWLILNFTSFRKAKTRQVFLMEQIHKWKKIGGEKRIRFKILLQENIFNPPLLQKKAIIF